MPKGDFGPDQPGSGERARPVAPPRKAPSATVASALDAGTVGVVGVEGVVGVRPASLDVSADGTLDDLRWERWDSGGAEGTGTLKRARLRPELRVGRQGRLRRPRSGSPRRACAAARPTSTARASSSTAPARAAEGDPTTYVRAPC